MPKLARSDWYHLSRDTNWTFRYVDEKEVFPEELSGSHRVSTEGCEGLLIFRTANPLGFSSGREGVNVEESSFVFSGV
jgi:hypothetical protein